MCCVPLCARCGISRKTGHKWLERYRLLGAPSTLSVGGSGEGGRGNQPPRPWRLAAAVPPIRPRNRHGRDRAATTFRAGPIGPARNVATLSPMSSVLPLSPLADPWTRPRAEPLEPPPSCAARIRATAVRPLEPIGAARHRKPRSADGVRGLRPRRVQGRALVLLDSFILALMGQSPAFGSAGVQRAPVNNSGRYSKCMVS